MYRNTQELIKYCQKIQIQDFHFFFFTDNICHNTEYIVILITQHNLLPPKMTVELDGPPHYANEKDKINRMPDRPRSTDIISEYPNPHTGVTANKAHDTQPQTQATSPFHLVRMIVFEDKKKLPALGVSHFHTNLRPSRSPTSKLSLPTCTSVVSMPRHHGRIHSALSLPRVRGHLAASGSRAGLTGT